MHGLWQSSLRSLLRSCHASAATPLLSTPPRPSRFFLPDHPERCVTFIQLFQGRYNGKHESWTEPLEGSVEELVQRWEDGDTTVGR